MKLTVEYVIKEIKQYLPEPRPVADRVITSDRFTGWVRNRLQHDPQVLVNAIICARGEMQDRLRAIERQLRDEFGQVGIGAIVLPYPIDDTEETEPFVAGLLKHLGSTLAPKDVIQVLSGAERNKHENSAYIIITIIEGMIIV